MVKERRCNMYDDNGRPRRMKDGSRGCHRDASACHFAHPHERAWETAHSSYPPRHDTVADSDSEFYYSLLHRGKGGRDRERDRIVESSRRPPTSPTSTSDKLRTRDVSRQDHVFKGSDRDRPRDPPPKDPPVREPHTAKTDPPPEPSKSPPMQPAPPPPQLPDVPDVPPFVSPRGPGEMSVDEQMSAWRERIDLMLTSITSRRDFTKLESDLLHVRRLANSTVVSNIQETDRAKLNAQKMALELQMEVKRKEVNETIQKLIGSGFWPVLRSPQNQVAGMEKTLADAKKHVLDMKNTMDEVRNGCAALLKTGASDQKQDPERPFKRRKLQESADGQSTSGDAEGVSEDTAKGLEVFHDKLTKLDRHLSDLENDITQRNGIISDEIELHIDARLEGEGALHSPVTGPAGVSQTEIEAIVDAKVTEIVHAVAVTGDEIGMLAVEIAELIRKTNDLEARCGVLEAENRELKDKLVQDTFDHTKSQEALVRRDKEIEAIAAALQAYISQGPADQAATGELPSAEYIIESLHGQLDGLLRDKFCATLTNVQKDVFDKVQESYDRTLNTISPKIILLLKMVNLITARLGKPNAEVVNTE